MLDGIEIKPLVRNVDERGCFTELMRSDRNDLLLSDRIEQVNYSIGYPGVVRAWHRHLRGQVDYFVVLEGSMKICAYDESSREMAEVVSSEDKLQVVRIPGHYWHGTKVVGNGTAKLLYFVNKLYDASKPDEERQPWDEPFIPKSINGEWRDIRCEHVWDWNRCVNK